MTEIVKGGGADTPIRELGTTKAKYPIRGVPGVYIIVDDNTSEVEILFEYSPKQARDLLDALAAAHPQHGSAP